MLVVADAAERNEGRRADEAGVAEVVVLVFDLGRPVLREHVFEAGADGVAIVMAAVERVGLRHAAERHRLVVVGVGIAALHVEQSRTPSVADAAGDRTKATLVVGIDRAVREHDAVVVAEPAVLAFDTDDPVGSELVVGAALQAAEEAAAAVVVERAGEAVVAAEFTADMAADIEAGPIVDRRDIGRSLGVVRRARSEIGGKCWHGRAESDEGHSTQ